MKSRRAVIGILETLYGGGGAHSRAFKTLIEDNYRRIVTASLPSDGPANWNRNAAKVLCERNICPFLLIIILSCFDNLRP